MGEQNKELTDEIQQLFQKTAEANKFFISEGSKLITQISTGKIPANKLAAVQKDFWTDAFQTVVKLNIQYTSSLLDIGRAFTQELNQRLQKDENGEPAKTQESERKESEAMQPAFVLHAKAAPGTTAFAHFLLDNNHPETVSCTLEPATFILAEDPQVKKDFNTTFSPQTFKLIPGVPQKVEINVDIPAKTKPGNFACNIVVDKNQGSYFTLYIQVTTDKEKNEENSTK